MSRDRTKVARNARAALLWTLLAACKPGLDLGRNHASVTLSQAVVIVPQDGAPAGLDLTLLGDAAGGTVTFPLSTTPGGVSVTRVRTNASTESLTFVADATALPGDYPVTVTAVNEVTGATSDPVAFTLTVAITVTVSSKPDPTLGIDGHLTEIATTAFQTATFQTHIPDPSALAAMHPPHPLVQIYEPTWLPDGGWDSSTLDDFVRTLDMVSTDGPELQIHTPPRIPGALDPSGTTFDFSKPANVTLFADYCANLVRYYNGGGFTYQGQSVVNPAGAALRVKWWGILGDSNNPDPTGSAYPNIYNQAVAEMLDADSTISVSALEFTDTPTDPPKTYLPAFIEPADAGGVNQPVDAVSVHMYATDRQDVLDYVLFQAVPAFGADIATLRSMLARRDDLSGVPVWVTQSNVNANVPTSAGLSASTLETFANDVRGTSAFYAAWAPYMFSQLGRNGAAAFTHWDYTAGRDPDASLSLDMQNAEVNYDTNTTFLSYWVDLALGQTYPPGVTPDILQTTTIGDPQGPSVDVLVTSSGGKIVVMFEDIAAEDAIDAGFTGAFPRTVVVDLGKGFAGTQFSATLLTIDGSTDRTAGPTPQPVTVPSDLRVSLSLSGYGVALLTLTPTP